MLIFLIQVCHQLPCMSNAELACGSCNLHNRKVSDVDASISLFAHLEHIVLHAGMIYSTEKMHDFDTDVSSSILNVYDTLHLTVIFFNHNSEKCMFLSNCVL